MPCSRAIISGYAAGFCARVSIGGVSCHYGPGLDGNDPLLSLRLYFSLFYVVLVLCWWTIALVWDGVMICSPWYLLEVYVWEIVGLIFVSRSEHCTIHSEFIICCS